MEMSSTSNQQSPNLGFHLLLENHRTQSNSPNDVSWGTDKHRFCSVERCDTAPTSESPIVMVRQAMEGFPDNIKDIVDAGRTGLQAKRGRFGRVCARAFASVEGWGSLLRLGGIQETKRDTAIRVPYGS